VDTHFTALEIDVVPPETTKLRCPQAGEGCRHQQHPLLAGYRVAIVAVDLTQPGTAPGHIIAGGHDFFASPRLSLDGRRLAWLAWDHPNMPWNGTILYVATLDENGAIFGAARRIAGGPAESIFQPEWSPDGSDIVFVSDRSGWWNLHVSDR
jgi:hypothetical protein